MEIIKFIYKEIEIEFEPANNKNLMINATQMAKVFGKTVEHFTRLDNTNLFIEACFKNPNMGFLEIKNKEDLIISKQKSGTWMHRVLALKFAAWLDADFEVWVFTTIDKLLYSEFYEQKQALIKKMTVKQQKKDKKIELLKKYPEMQEYFNLEEKEKEAHNKRTALIRNQIKQLKFQF